MTIRKYPIRTALVAICLIAAILAIGAVGISLFVVFALIGGAIILGVQAYRAIRSWLEKIPIYREMTRRPQDIRIDPQSRIIRTTYTRDPD